MRVEERFLRYVAIGTQAEDNREEIPSTPGQWDLAKVLVEELKEMGASDVALSEYCYVTATIPSTLKEGQSAPVLGFIAHMDTAMESSGENVKARIVKAYDGGDVALGNGLTLSPSYFPSLKNHVGDDLIVTDGTTLLGADDKAGVAEIMAMAEYFLTHPEIPHGTIRIAFTPDEEVGNGPKRFDVAGFGAQFAYTVDGGALGEIEYENFNAAGAEISFRGVVVHPGTAKDQMKNACHIAMHYHSLLPEKETPAHTDGYEGFFHMTGMTGRVAEARTTYLIRDHDKEKFLQRKALMVEIGEKINEIYGEGSCVVALHDSYYNMREMIEPHMELIERAEAAMRENGVAPKVMPIRGGTDGSQLSYMGLPCPNLCTGGYNFHGPYEYCPVQAMEKVVEILACLARKFVETK